MPFDTALEHVPINFMNLSNSRATIGLQSKATPTSTATSGSLQIGANPSVITFPDAVAAYSIRAFFATGNFTPELTTGVTTGSTAFVAGTAQVETATAAGDATTSGDVTATITSAGMTGSPLAISVAILSGDTAAVWAGKVRTALAANTTIAARFTVSGTSTSIVLTRKPDSVLTDDTESVNILLANDSTLNIALGAGSTGVTAAPTSTNTTAGVATSGVLIRNGDGDDVEGIAIPTIDPVGVLFVVTTNSLTVSGGGSLAGLTLSSNSSTLFAGANQFSGETDLTITASAAILTLTVIGDISA